jgi:hypothetical protein
MARGSIVVREYGILAMLGSGQRITVDGGAVAPGMLGSSVSFDLVEDVRRYRDPEYA